MSAQIHQVGKMKDEFLESVKRAISDATEAELESIVIVGIIAQTGNVYFKHSGFDSTLKMLGALEYAKIDLVKVWE